MMALILGIFTILAGCGTILVLCLVVARVISAFKGKAKPCPFCPHSKDT